MEPKMEFIIKCAADWRFRELAFSRTVWLPVA